MTLPHYTDRCYESARQRRRYQADPAYRLDRINRARKRLGLPPHKSLLSAKINFSFEPCALNVSRLLKPRTHRKHSKRTTHCRLLLLRRTA